ncbi:MAG: helix-turn-helix transcriptional regulator, partial [Actinobacteria bacterium]|nr:helix-turn-helix transcriptional regulator [Actinomycetota bacterium]
EGSLCPLLARMREAGALETRWEAGEGSRARRYYAVTERGRAQLRIFAEVWNDIAGQVGELIEEER